MTNCGLKPDEVYVLSLDPVIGIQLCHPIFPLLDVSL